MRSTRSRVSDRRPGHSAGTSSRTSSSASIGAMRRAAGTRPTTALGSGWRWRDGSRACTAATSSWFTPRQRARPSGRASPARAGVDSHRRRRGITTSIVFTVQTCACCCCGEQASVGRVVSLSIVSVAAHTRTDLTVPGPEGFQAFRAFFFFHANLRPQQGAGNDSSEDQTTDGSDDPGGAISTDGGHCKTQPATTLAGRWDAVVIVNGVEVPFPFRDCRRRRRAERARSSTASAASHRPRLPTEDGSHLRSDSSIMPRPCGRPSTQDSLTGEYRRARGEPSALPRSPGVSLGRAALLGRAIHRRHVGGAGGRATRVRWPGASSPSRRANQVDATILRVDGDTGTGSGTFRDGRFVLETLLRRPALTARGDRRMPTGRCPSRQNGQTGADRSACHRIGGRGNRHSDRPGTAHPHEGRVGTVPSLAFPISRVASLEPVGSRSFRGKVVLVNISGSWCPNCHDEAPFLSALYRELPREGIGDRHALLRGSGSNGPLMRLRAFIATYGLDYTVLLPGEPDQLNEKVPQAENLNAFPTTFILGRDGRVPGGARRLPEPRQR